jgi:isopenicillin N synthase-like dioxygenase
MMQYITNSFLPSTPHKVGLNTRERFAFAYFHEPNFSAVMKPLEGFQAGQEPTEGIHYGSHFTNMFMRNYPQRITADRMKASDDAVRTVPYEAITDTKVGSVREKAATF